MNILGIDSTTKNLSIAVSKDHKMSSELIDSNSTGHMVNIIENIDRVLKKSGLKLKDVDIFCVNRGPGDFMGTRIGISVIKILALVENKLAYGIKALDAYALKIINNNIKLIARSVSNLESGIKTFIMPCLDVKRDEVYFSFYDISPENERQGQMNYISKINISGKPFIIRESGIQKKNILNIKDFLEWIKNFSSGKEPLLSGDPGCGSRLSIIAGGNFFNYKGLAEELKESCSNIILDWNSMYANAANVNHCAYFKAVQKIEAFNIIPVYIRDFVPFGR